MQHSSNAPASRAQWAPVMQIRTTHDTPATAPFRMPAGAHFLGYASFCLLAACTSVAKPDMAAPHRPQSLDQDHGAPPSPTTFVELLATPRIAYDSGPRDCLIAATEAGIWLASPTTPATKQMPEPPPLLSTMMDQHSGPVRILSTWGQIGRAVSGPALVTVTRVPARAMAAPAFALLLSNGKAWLRNIQGTEGTTPSTAMEPAVAMEWLRTHAPSGAVVFLTADANYSTTNLADVLRDLPARLPPVLAVALPNGTVLPVPQARVATAQECAALPETADRLEPGELNSNALHNGLAPLIGSVRMCMAAATAAPMGKVVLAMRVTGARVTEACLQEDEIRNSVLATCLVQAAQRLTFVGLEPSSYQDLYLPLRLSPDEPPAPRALCSD